MVKQEVLERVYEARSLDDLREAYDGWADTYDETISGDFGFRGHQEVVDEVRPLLADDAEILDAGAGSGALGVSAAGAGFSNIDAMDLSEGMLEVARERGVYRTTRIGILGEPLDYADDAYDAALSSGVFTPGHAPPSGALAPSNTKRGSRCRHETCGPLAPVWSSSSSGSGGRRRQRSLRLPPRDRKTPSCRSPTRCCAIRIRRTG